MLRLLKLARIQFLIGGVALFLLGALWAVLLGSDLSVPRLILGYLIVFSCQLSVHFSNDYFDMATDRLGGGTLISGGAGVLQKDPELRGTVLWIAVLLILFSLGMGLLFILIFSYPFWMIGFVALANLIGWSYSAPPLRLCARGLGELAYGFISGVLAPSMGYFVMRGTLDMDALFFVFPLTLYGLATMLAVEIPDVEDDRMANKWTWVARWGRKFGFLGIGLLLIAATSYFFLFPALSPRPIPLNLRVLGVFSLLPLAVGIWGMVRRPQDRKLSVNIATGVIISLVVFAIFVDSYLFYQAVR